MTGNYGINELVKVARRENNAKRPYLYVNPIQGKHIPAKPSDTLLLLKKMAEIIGKSYPDERLLVIGFAETATAIGAGISVFSDNVAYCMHTTREKYEGAEYLYFSESHSHASEQSLIINGLAEIIGNIDRIIFAEDEVTTGNTILKLISEILGKFGEYALKFGIISVLNSMTDERIKYFESREIPCHYVKKIPFEYNSESIGNYECNSGNFSEEFPKNEFDGKYEIPGYRNLRYIQGKSEYERSCREFCSELAEKINLGIGRKILILGTEEFMFPALMFADYIATEDTEREVRFHASTRSPILVSSNENYPLFSRYRLESIYESGRVTYIYNLTKYDCAVVITDAKINKKGENELAAVLKNEGCREIKLVRWAEQ